MVDGPTSEHFGAKFSPRAVQLGRYSASFLRFLSNLSWGGSAGSRRAYNIISYFIYTYIGGWGCESVVRPPLTGKSISIALAFALRAKLCVRGDSTVAGVGLVKMWGWAAAAGHSGVPRGSAVALCVSC